jgi:hypothetical protein
MSPERDHYLQSEKDADPNPCSEPPSLSKNELFHLISTTRRREVIRYLLETGGQVGLPKLARHVAALEYETSVEDVTQAQYQRIYIPLYQSHLPKLDEAGVIRYDSTKGLVEPTTQLNAFAPYLKLSPHEKNDAQSSSETMAFDRQAVGNWYLGSAGLSAILLLAVTLGLIPISGEFLGGIIIALFLVANGATKR